MRAHELRQALLRLIDENGHTTLNGAHMVIGGRLRDIAAALAVLITCGTVTTESQDNHLLYVRTK
jgi:hypothetical protein